MRRTFIVIHRWGGLAAALFLILISVSGTLLIFEEGLDRWTFRHMAYVTPAGQLMPLGDLVAKVEAATKGQVLSVQYPEKPEFASRLIVTQAREVRFTYVNPYTGDVLGAISQPDREHTFQRRIYNLHTKLLAGDSGRVVVEIVTGVALLLTLSGLYIWWPRKILSMSRTSNWRRWNFDFHSALGFYTSVFSLILTASGLLIAFGKTADPVIKKLDTVQAPARPRVAPEKGRPTIGPDALVSIARNALPGAEVRFINGPFRQPMGQVSMRYPEDHTPGGRSFVLVNQYSGEVLQVQSTRTAGQAGTRIINALRALHTGAIYGAASQVLFGLSSFALAVQSVSGFFMWWRPRRSERQVPATTRGVTA
jgi:uncharacterized iron-regulated membrane protein